LAKLSVPTWVPAFSITCKAAIPTALYGAQCDLPGPFSLALSSEHTLPAAQSTPSNVPGYVRETARWQREPHVPRRR
jgi:hypothetical protein